MKANVTKMKFLLVEDLQAQREYYKDIPDEQFYAIIKEDPTYKESDNTLGVYGKLLLKLLSSKKIEYSNGDLEDSYTGEVLAYDEDGIHYSTIADTLDAYDAAKNDLKDRDIMKIKSYHDLVRFLADENNYKQLTDRQKRRRMLHGVKIGQDADLVFSNSDWEVLIPKNKEASCKLGNGSHLCTASTTNNYYNYYLDTDGGEYLMFMNKKDKTDSFQIHFESNQCMDYLHNSDMLEDLPDIFNNNQELVTDGRMQTFFDKLISFKPYIAAAINNCNLPLAAIEKLVDGDPAKALNMLKNNPEKLKPYEEQLASRLGISIEDLSSLKGIRYTVSRSDFEDALYNYGSGYEMSDKTFASLALGEDYIEIADYSYAGKHGIYLHDFDFTYEPLKKELIRLGIIGEDSEDRDIPKLVRDYYDYDDNDYIDGEGAVCTNDEFVDAVVDAWVLTCNDDAYSNAVELAQDYLLEMVPNGEIKYTDRGPILEFYSTDSLSGEDEEYGTLFDKYVSELFEDNSVSEPYYGFEGYANGGCNDLLVDRLSELR